jgi:hypothetical protein
MQAREAAKMLGGSIAIYVIMAACSAGQPGGFTLQDGSVSNGSGSGGASGGVSSSGSDGTNILDALTDPVPTAAADPTQSGTRLKVNYYAGTDGSKQPTGNMHDSMLNVDCSFLTASDGTLRCMPSGTGLTGFVDSGCTQPLAIRTKGCSAPAYGVKPVTACDAGDVWHVFPITGAYSGASYYSGAPGACAASPTSGLTAYDLYSTGAELPPSTFAQATIQQD